MEQHEKYMSRAIELARLGSGKVSPNPMVGCVIVSNDEVIGEGWHRAYGGPHAEVNAVDDVKDLDQLKDSALYVTLEPCNHYGKTPPCTDLILKNEMSKVIVGSLDPNPLVAGTGIEKLRSAGVEVETNVLKDQCSELNKRFFCFHRKKRPYVILKWAETQDGFVARNDFDSKWISSELSRQLVHKWRTEEDAILVGYKTAFYDNPSLTSRDYFGKNPLRLLIDFNHDLPNTYNLFDGKVKTVVYSVQEKTSESSKVENSLIRSAHIVDDILHDLFKKNILSLIVEGGSKTLSQFIESGNWDEIRLFRSGKTFEDGIQSPIFEADLQEKYEMDGDELFIYYPRKQKK
ncbi:MAG: bifunctional diaminohydroxyphosphoribosylaminopyrimidine deaminase/5-amino-6-(5-phosphoribosylamino)uracil reductase RibD [Bacteroidota bacterium]